MDYRWWVFESWGRISTTISSKRLTDYGKVEEAIAKFQNVFKEKTGNQFGTGVFRKYPDNYYLLDVVFEMPKQITNRDMKTNLNEPVFKLMELLFDTKKMENMMLNCELDLKQMPLGKISSNQVMKAMRVLNEVSSLIRRNGSPRQLRETSNRFYTLIPHAFSVKRPPIIDSLDMVNEKNQMLENLLNMDLIYFYLNEQSDEKIHPLDGCYSKLNAEIVPLDKDSPEFWLWKDIVKNCHGSTHSEFNLEVEEIFEVVRAGEDDRFKPFENFPGRCLLWHGSPLMNYVSILSNGLKIAPPEAPPTGYMFGKGIYFADVVSKSAKYCRTTNENNTGLLMLCEVYLGTSACYTTANQALAAAPAGYQSVKGCGILVPSGYGQFGSATFFNGSVVQSPLRSTLCYIVYSPDQVKTKYLFKVKFCFNKVP